MKVAIVHDWLDTWGGSEQVLAEMLAIFPKADLLTLVDFLPEPQRAPLASHRIVTSFVQKLPWARKHFRNYLPLLPFAVEQFDLRGYEVIISSSHAVAKGVITGPEQLHICMCYSPPRYAWDLQFQYLEQAGLASGLKGWVVRWQLHRLRLWDVRASVTVDHFIAISHYIARRIRKCYRRDATVIYPPVDVDHFHPSGERQRHYVTLSRMVPYKRIDIIVEAFARMPDRTLIVAGTGPEEAKIRALGATNVKFLGQVSAPDRLRLLQEARAFVFAAEEDFGIAPLEAQACGTPVIAYGRGAVSETIRSLHTQRPSGVLFDAQTPEAVIDAVERFEAAETSIAPEACRDNALRFAPSVFRRQFGDFVAATYDKFVAERLATLPQ